MSVHRISTRLLRSIALAFTAAFICSLASGLLGDDSIRVSSAPAAASAGPNFAGTASNTTWTTPSFATEGSLMPIVPTQTVRTHQLT